MSNSENSGADLKRERDRFVAFAFSAADAFVELDKERQVRYATGAIRSMIGADAKNLLGRDFLDLLAPDDRATMQACWDLAVKQGRFGPLHLHALSQANEPTRIELRGTYLSINGGGLYLSINRIVDGRTAMSDLMDKEGFSHAAQDALKAAQSGDHPAILTLLDLEGLDKVMARMDEVDAVDLMTDINVNIKARSISGDAAGQLDNEHFGVVHDPDVDIPSLEDAISARARKADPKGQGIKVQSASIDLEGEELSDFDDAKALLYTINRFSAERGSFTIKDLQQGYKMMLKDTRAKIAVFKNTVVTGDFSTYYQPIVDLRNRDVHHYEALLRLNGAGPEDSPYEFITFAEDTGVITELDLAICGRVMRHLEKIKKQGRELSVAVNLSGRSLESPVFLDKLLQLLGHFSPPRSWLQFEVTESSVINDLEATNNYLGSLRDMGHAVCLDDFGSGSAAFQYLNALDVDCVKIDGAYVQQAQNSAKGKAFIRSIVMLWRDLGIDTVGEMVETEESSSFLREVGVRYGQGYLFGKPTRDITGWRPANVKRSAAGS